MTTELIHTRFSTYEVDWEATRVRRLVGLNAPTPRLGEDNEWTQATNIAVVAYPDGPALLIHYGEGRCTVSSAIQSRETQTERIHDEQQPEH